MKNYHNTKFSHKSFPLALIFLGAFGNSILSEGQVLPPPGSIPPPPSVIPSFPGGIPAPPSVVPPGAPAVPSIPPPASVAPPLAPPDTPVAEASLPVSPTEAIPTGAGFLGAGKFGDPAELVGIEGLDEPLDRIKLRDMPAKDALEMLQLWTGRYILRPQNLPQMQLNFDSFSVLTKREALMAIESLLAMNGIALTMIDNLFWKAIPALGVNAQVPIWLDGPTTAVRPSQRIYVKLFHLEYAKALKVREQLNAFATPNVSSIIVFETANSLLITDSLLNLQRIEKLLGEIDRAVPPDEIGMELFQYTTQNMDPEKLLNVLGPAFKKGGALESIVQREPSLFADGRSGQIFVVLHKQDKEFVEQLIEGLDIPVKVRAISKRFALQNASVLGKAKGDGQGVLKLLEEIITKRTDARKDEDKRARQRREETSQITQKSGKPAKSDAKSITTTLSSSASLAGTGTSNVGSDRNQEFSSYLTVLGDERSNSILVYGSQTDIEQIGEIIELLDKPLPMAQIDTIFVMVNINSSGSRGIDLFSGAFQYDKSTARVETIVNPQNGTTQDINFPASDQLVGAISPPGLGGPISFTLDSWKLQKIAWDNIFKIAQSNSDSRVFSSPSIVVSHNSDDVEISMKNTRTIITDYGTRSSTGTGTNNQGGYNSGTNDKEFSSETTLELIEPRISLPKTLSDGNRSEGGVFTKVRLVTSKFTDEGASIYGGQTIPATQKRTLQTSISFKNNEIIALGGLQQIEVSKSENQYGLLRKIPILGKSLFSPKSETYQPTEILIFMRARIFEEGTANNFINPSRIDEMFQQDYVPRFESPVTGDSPKSDFLQLGNTISSDKSSSKDQPSSLPRL
jgi:general secretion pathway protein D